MVGVDLTVVEACLLDSRRGAGFVVAVAGSGSRHTVVVLVRLDIVAVRPVRAQLKMTVRRVSLAVSFANLMLER